MSVALVVNRRSRAGRRDPALLARLASLVGEPARVAAPETLADLEAEAARLMASRPSTIAIHGGDGTLHRVLSALGRAAGATPLPPIAILGGGTMNVVAASLGLRRPAEPMLRWLLAADQAGRAPQRAVRRRTLKIDDAIGFVFGNGLVAQFLEEYYARPGHGRGRAVELLARAFGSAVVRGPLVERLFRRFHGRVFVDGRAVGGDGFVAISAATVREVGLGFKLNHRADEDPDRFAVLAVHAGALALATDLLAVRRGAGVSPRHAESALARELRIEPARGEMTYTIDGDLYRAGARLAVTVGPEITFVRPPPALALTAAAAAGARAPWTRAARRDTMEGRA